MGIIAVEGIRLHAYHGCLEEEARIGTDYCVDVNVDYDYSKAASTDDLSDTVDYVVIYRIVKSQMAIRSKLIEHVAKRIYDEIIKVYPAINSLEVKVAKSNPPVNGLVDRSVVIYKG